MCKGLPTRCCGPEGPGEQEVGALEPSYVSVAQGKVENQSAGHVERSWARCTEFLVPGGSARRPVSAGCVTTEAACRSPEAQCRWHMAKASYPSPGMVFLLQVKVCCGEGGWWVLEQPYGGQWNMGQRWGDP